MRFRTTAALALFCLSAGCRQEPVPANIADGTAPFFAPSSRRGFVRIAWTNAGDEFSREKPRGTFRLFIVGCSLAQILDQEVSFKGYLKRALPSLDIQIIDCGLGGLDAQRAANIVEEAVRYDADAVIYAGGHHHEAPLTPVRAKLWRLWAGRLLLDTRWRELGRSLLPPPDAASATSPEVREELFAQGLRKMGRVCREKGATLLVCLPPINYRGTLAGRVEWPYRHRPFIRARLMYIRRDYRGALEAFAAAARDPKADAGVRTLALHYEARCAERLGQTREAASLYRASANDQRHTGPGASPDRLEHERGLAAADHDRLVDLDGDLRRLSAPRLPGFDVFEDVSHWRPELAGLIVTRIIQAMRTSSSLRGLPWDDRELAAMAKSEEAASARRLKARPPSELGFALAAAGVDPEESLPWQSLAALEALHERAPSLFASWQAVPEMALRNPLSTWVANPVNSRVGGTPARLLWAVGELMLEAGRPADAAAALSRARELEPRLRGSWLSQALADHLLGDAAAVARDLERASEAGLTLESDALALVLKGN
jgi:hypothetical protein